MQIEAIDINNWFLGIQQFIYYFGIMDFSTRYNFCKYIGALQYLARDHFSFTPQAATSNTAQIHDVTITWRSYRPGTGFAWGRWGKWKGGTTTIVPITTRSTHQPCYFVGQTDQSSMTPMIPIIRVRSDRDLSTVLMGHDMTKLSALSILRHLQWFCYQQHRWQVQ